jgi:hypothetical protein
MKSILLVLGYVAAVLSLIFSVTPLFKIAFITGAAALLLVLGSKYFSKDKSGFSLGMKILLAILVLSLLISTYKTIFVTAEVGDTETLIETEIQSEQDAIEELEGLDLEEFEDFESDDLEGLDTEEMGGEDLDLENFDDEGFLENDPEIEF